MSVSEMVLRVLASVFLGGALGLNRYVHRRYVGLRTLSVVSLTGAALTLVSTQHFGGDGVSRVIQGLLTGVGFIGAGVIVHGRPRGNVRGLTSAAAVFLCVGIGILCAMADWTLVTTVFVVALVILLFGGPTEKLLTARYGSDSKSSSEQVDPDD